MLGLILGRGDIYLGATYVRVSCGARIRGREVGTICDMGFTMGYEVSMTGRWVFKRPPGNTYSGVGILGTEIGDDDCSLKPGDTGYDVLKPGRLL